MKYLYLILKLFFCGHKWKFYSTTKVVDSDGDQIKQIVTLSCSKCGNLKKYVVSD